MNKHLSLPPSLPPSSLTFTVGLYMGTTFHTLGGHIESPTVTDASSTPFLPSLNPSFSTVLPWAEEEEEEEGGREGVMSSRERGKKPALWVLETLAARPGTLMPREGEREEGG